MIGSETRIDDYKVYSSFVRPEDILELIYMPMMPNGGDLKQSYQRSLKKDAKVNQISNYLMEKGSFFPNSVVCAVSSGECEFVSEFDLDYSSIGK